MKTLPQIGSLVLGVALSPLLNADVITIPEMVAKAKPAVVQIVAVDANQNPIQTGTGFFISSDGLLLTNDHVIQKAADLFARTDTGAIFIFRSVVFRSVDLDVALLKFAARGISHVELGSSVGAFEGQRVVVIGSPQVREPTVSYGIISTSRNNRSSIEITTPVSPGFSGSPVLDESGLVVGIVTSIGEGGQNLYFATPIEKFKLAFLAKP
jgi:serine protease Do